MADKNRGRIGYWLSGLYIAFVLILLGSAFLGRPDALSGLGLVVATLPWSYLVGQWLESSNGSGGIGDASALVASVFFLLLSLPNAFILYGLGSLIDWLRHRDPRVQ